MIDLSGFARAALLSSPTPLERLDALSQRFGIDLWIKRDDLTGLSFGGNKTRQLEFYIGDALARGATTILITGAVQSNFVRTAAAAAAKHGLKAVLQHENRVEGMDETYHRSGNVLLARLWEAEIQKFPHGEDESGADAALIERGEALNAEGEVPYLIPLGLGHPPLGALGYVAAAQEVLSQLPEFDVSVVPSGSGSTHAGWLTGLKMAGHEGQVHGICVRRDASAQADRLDQVTQALATLMETERPFGQADILTTDSALPPGYGQISEKTLGALKLMARTEGILLDPVYSAKTFAGLIDLVESGAISKGQRVLFVHTGGLPALFAYQNQL